MPAALALSPLSNDAPRFCSLNFFRSNHSQQHEFGRAAQSYQPDEPPRDVELNRRSTMARSLAS
jgi:hypothetical protein